MPVSRKSKNKKSSGGSKSQKKNIYKKHKTMKKNILLQKGGVTLVSKQNFNDIYPMHLRPFLLVKIYEYGKGNKGENLQIFSGLLSDFDIDRVTNFRKHDYEITLVAPQIPDDPHPNLL